MIGWNAFSKHRDIIKRTLSICFKHNKKNIINMFQTQGKEHYQYVSSIKGIKNAIMSALTFGCRTQKIRNLSRLLSDDF